MVNIVFILVLVFLIILSGLLSGSETALFSLSKMKISIFKNSKNRREQIVYELVSNPKELLVTILVLNIGVNIAVQNIVANMFEVGSSWLIVVGVPLILTLLFGEIIPKSIAISRNVDLSIKVAPVMLCARVMLKPIRKIFIFISTGIFKVFAIFFRSSEEISLNELKHALVTSRDVGILTADEAKLINGSLKIDELLVKEIMIPRSEILYYDIEKPLSQLIEIFVKKECSRIPITHGDIENVIGVMTADLYFLHSNEIITGNDIVKFCKQPVFVPETLSARQLFSSLQDSKSTMSLIVDEYGSVCGLVTKEDIVEIIIGQIEDKSYEKPMYVRHEKDVVIFNGRAEIDVVNELFDVNLESENNMVTLGGWLTEKIGDIPKNGMKYISNNLLFHILSSTPQKVSKIYVRKISPQKKLQRSLST